MKAATNPTIGHKSTNIPVIQRIIAVLWPSFLTSGVATGLFFTAFDPIDLMTISGHEAELSRTAVYSIGFFMFWLLTATTCGLTCYFQKPCEQIKGHR
jgi:cytosine/uracil/thiamine/allantoin permease